MQFDGKFFTLLVFIVINFFILFVVKTRTSLVISVIIAHLVAVLFFALSISNYHSFREITLALIIYSMVILFVISNYGLIVVDVEKIQKSKLKLLKNATIYIFAALVFTMVCAVVGDIDKMREEYVVTENQAEIPADFNALKKAQMRDKLLDNFLLKRSSDVILIMAVASTVLLLLSKKEK